MREVFRGGSTKTARGERANGAHDATAYLGLGVSIALQSKEDDVLMLGVGGGDCAHRGSHIHRSVIRAIALRQPISAISAISCNADAVSIHYIGHERLV